MRYYYPIEFVTTCLNIWSNDIEKMTNVTKYANKKGIKIINPKFRYSKGDYFPNKSTNSIYKGINSIKYMNATIADELYSLRDNKYNGFIELLLDIEKLSLNTRQMSILITLGFFAEFGKSARLMKIYETFKSLYGKKIIKKNNTYGLSHETMLTLCKKETASQYSNINSIAVIEAISCDIKDEELQLKDILKCEIDNIGYVTYTNSEYNDDVFVVLELKTNKWGTPFALLYRLNDGVKKEVKIDKKYYSSKPIGECDIIIPSEIVEQNKKRKDNGRWIEIDEKEIIMKSYKMVKGN